MQLFLSILTILFLLLLIDFCIAQDCKLNYTNPYHVIKNIIVDGSGNEDFVKIQDAINSIPSFNSEWIRIQINSGDYREKVSIPQYKECIFIDGEDMETTRILWGDHANTNESATFTSMSDNLVVQGITFKNTFEPSKDESGDDDLAPASAVSIYGDKSAFYHCAFYGLQDTLGDILGRHYFENCYIEGEIDFIFGYAQSIYQGCIISLNIGIYARKGSIGAITAQGRDSPDDSNGFVFKNCNITGTGKAYLGRAWNRYSRVIFSNTTMGDVIVPEGWSAWNQADHTDDITYVEDDGCSGPGADKSNRVTWEKSMERSELQSFLDLSFIDDEGWIVNLPKLSN